MRIDVKGILEGAWNSLFIRDSIEKVHQERMAICRQCIANSERAKLEKGYKTFRPDLHCTLCGCNLDMKTRCMSCECPDHQWDKVMTAEEEQQLTDKIDQHNGSNS